MPANQAEAVDLTPRRSDAHQALQYLHDSPVRHGAMRHGELGVAT